MSPSPSAPSTPVVDTASALDQQHLSHSPSAPRSPRPSTAHTTQTHHQACPRTPPRRSLNLAHLHDAQHDDASMHTCQHPGGTQDGSTLEVMRLYASPKQDLPPNCPVVPQSPGTPRRAGGEVSNDLARALKAVVKVFTTSSNPNHSLPWQMHAQCKSTASGFVIAPLSQRRILTNAHAVTNTVHVALRKHGDARKYTARVIATGHECDIAMLTVDDDDFWTPDVVALEIRGMPRMQEGVTVVGYPTGGDNVCVTKGVVSRIDRQQYSHSKCSLIAVQIDAAINHGNSGGPVLRGGQVVGIAFQCLTSGENIGYIIPVPVIHHFLNDLHQHDGSYTGFCELGITWQTLESPAFRRYLGMPPDMTGIYITRTEPLFHAHEVLKAGDVLTHFDGVPVADDGTVLYSQAVRIDFRHLVSLNFDGDLRRVKVWREGQPLEVGIKLRTPQQLVPVHSHDVKPSYLIYAGLVFVQLSAAYLRSQYGADWACKAPLKLCERALAGSKDLEGQEVVVLSKVLASEINTGYQDLVNIQLKKVAGQDVRSLMHLAEVLGKGPGEDSNGFTRFDLEWNKVVIIDHQQATELGHEVLIQNSIERSHSSDLEHLALLQV